MVVYGTTKKNLIPVPSVCARELSLVWPAISGCDSLSLVKEVSHSSVLHSVFSAWEAQVVTNTPPS